MTEITKRALLGASGLAVLAAGASAAPLEGGPFVSKHTGAFNGRKVDYVATVSATTINGPDGRPGARLVTTAYTAAGVDAAKRPVLFAFNGGPSSSSSTLHMAALGPKRIAFAQDPKVPAPAPSMADN